MRSWWSALLTAIPCLIALLPMHAADAAPAPSAPTLTVQWSGSGSAIARLSLANVHDAGGGAIGADLVISNQKSVYYNLAFTASGGVTDQVGDTNLFTTLQRSAQQIGAPYTLFPLAGNSNVTLAGVTFPPRAALTVRFAKFGDGPKLAVALATLDLVLLVSKARDIPDPGQALSGQDDVAFAVSLLGLLQRAGFDIEGFAAQLQGGDVIGALTTLAGALGRAGPALAGLLHVSEQALASLAANPGALLGSFDLSLLPVLYDLTSAPLAGAVTITNSNAGTATPPAAGSTAIVLIPGVLSESGDHGFDRFQSLLRGALQHTALAGATYLPYSYTGGGFSQSGDWQPSTYQCQDTFDHALQADLTHLNDLISGYLAHHHGATIYLIGHSQGGLIAFSYLAYLKARQSPAWSLPNDGVLGGVVTIDSPVGGIPSAVGLSLATTYYDVRCSDMSAPIRLPYLSLAQMYAIAATAGGHPRGGQASVARALYGVAQSNQDLASEAARHGIRVLTVGNTLDYTFAPCPTVLHVSDVNIDTQWLQDGADGTPIYGRAVALGSLECSIPSLADNHGLALDNRDSQGHGYANPVPGAVARFLTGAAPDPLKTPLADLAVDAAVQPLETVVGDQFTIVLRNLGGRAAAGTLLRDSVSGAGGLISVHADGLTCITAATTITCTGTLAVYGAASLTIAASTSLSGGLITNTATANPDHTIPVLESSHAGARTVALPSA